MTHPFHPWFGREFDLVDYRQNWGEDRVCFVDEQGRVDSILASYTDARREDPFVSIAAGRAHFRYDDLLELAELIARLRGGNTGAACKVNFAATVKTNMPRRSRCDKA